MKRNEKIFVTKYDTVEPTRYIENIMLRCNKNVLEDNEMFLGLSHEEIKDLCAYHTDPHILQFKANGTANKWIELSNIYK